MTRLAIVSDVHADVHALADALVQAERLGCELVVCAGDIVDYGLFPEETIALLYARKIPCIRGNHDRWAVGRGNTGERSAAPSDTGNDAQPTERMHDASGFDLPVSALRFLGGLPSAWRKVLDSVRVAVHHGSPGSDMEGIYPDSAPLACVQRWLDRADADVLIVGHTHHAFALTAPDGRLIANPGALLRAPANRAEPAWVYDAQRGAFAPLPTLTAEGGTFGVLELPARRFTVHRAADGCEVEIPRITLGT